MDEPIITICILHYNKLPQLKQTIENIEKNTGFPFNIKILNQGYIDQPIKDYLSKLSERENIEVELCSRNLGCPAGRNKLLKKINTEYVMTLDDDIYLPKNWFKYIKSVFDTKSNVGGVGFLLYSPEGELDSIGGRNIVVHNNVVKMIEPKVPVSSKENEVLQVDDLSGGAMVFRRGLLSEFNWDPNYFLGFGDLDKGLQLKTSDYNFYVDTRVKAIHDKVSKKRRATEYNKARRDYKEIRKSYVYFIDKWGYKFPWKRHLFYKYFTVLPSPIVREFVYLWLKR